MVKPQYLTGILKAGIRPSLSRIPLDSASFEHPRAGVNQVLLTYMATRTAVGSNRHNDDTFGPVGAATESKSPARANFRPQAAPSGAAGLRQRLGLSFNGWFRPLKLRGSARPAHAEGKAGVRGTASRWAIAGLVPSTGFFGSGP